MLRAPALPAAGAGCPCCFPASYAGRQRGRTRGVTPRMVRCCGGAGRPLAPYIDAREPKARRRRTEMVPRPRTTKLEMV